MCHPLPTVRLIWLDVQHPSSKHAPRLLRHNTSATTSTAASTSAGTTPAPPPVSVAQGAGSTPLHLVSGTAVPDGAMVDCVFNDDDGQPVLDMQHSVVESLTVAPQLTNLGEAVPRYRAHVLTSASCLLSYLANACVLARELEQPPGVDTLCSRAQPEATHEHHSWVHPGAWWVSCAAAADLAHESARPVGAPCGRFAVASRHQQGRRVRAQPVGC